MSLVIDSLAKQSWETRDINAHRWKGTHTRTRAHSVQRNRTIRGDYRREKRFFYRVSLANIIGIGFCNYHGAGTIDNRSSAIFLIALGWRMCEETLATTASSRWLGGKKFMWIEVKEKFH